MSARTFKPTETVDFVVVGSGAAGGVMARELAQAGFEVLVLEQGPRFTAADFRHDELDYWFNNALLNSPEASPQTFRKSARDKAARVRDFPRSGTARMVGGSSNHFTANFWRFHEVDFRERSLLGAIAGTSFADWPIDYAELEPTTPGSSGKSVCRDWPAQAVRSAAVEALSDAPLPVKSSACCSNAGRASSACTRSPRRWPSPRCRIAAAKLRALRFLHGLRLRDAGQVVDLVHRDSEAEATGRCEVRSESYVSRIDVNDRDRVTGVTYFDRDKREHFQKARAVVVCANGAETARLLLMSAAQGTRTGSPTRAGSWAAI